MALVRIVAAAVAASLQGMPDSWAAVAAVLQSTTPSAQASIAADLRELSRLRREVPKPTTGAKLLNLPELASAMNYPADALEKEEEGTAVVWLLVGSGGQVERCGLQLSSGSDSLDSATCRLMIEKARLEPARDQDAKPIRSIVTQAFTWQLEDEVVVISAEELRQLEAGLPKAATPAKLLNTSDIANAMDYPKTALSRKQTGQVSLALVVGSDGRVERCEIDRSSGSSALDAQSCALFVANARFQPATDRRGRPVRTLFRQRMTWRLQDGPTVLPKDWATRTSVIVGSDFKVRSCKSDFHFEGQWQETPAEVCNTFLKFAMELIAAAREKSRLHDAHVVFETWVVSNSGLTIPDVGRRSGEKLVMLRSATAVYGPDGRRTNCTSGESFGIPTQMIEICEVDGGGIPLERPAADKATEETVRVVSAIYLKDEPN